MRAAIATTAFAAVHLASAQTAYWQGGNGDWGTLSNWTTFPYNGPAVVIGSSFGNPTLTTLGGTTPVGVDNWGSQYYEFAVRSLTSTAGLTVNAPKDKERTLQVFQGGTINGPLTIRGGIRSGDYDRSSTLTVTGLTTWEQGDLSGNFDFQGGLTSLGGPGFKSLDYYEFYNYLNESKSRITLGSQSRISGFMMVTEDTILENRGTLSLESAYIDSFRYRWTGQLLNKGTINVSGNTYLRQNIDNQGVFTVLPGSRLIIAGNLRGAISAIGATIGISADFDISASVSNATIEAAKIGLNGDIYMGGTVLKGPVSLDYGRWSVSSDMVLDSLSITDVESVLSVATGKTMTVNGSSIWSGGSLNGRFKFLSGLSGTPSLGIIGGWVTVGGASHLVGGWSPIEGRSATLENLGNLTLEELELQAVSGSNRLINSGSLSFEGEVATNFTFENSGTAQFLGDTTLSGGGTNSGTFAVAPDGTVDVTTSAFTLTSTSILQMGLNSSSFGQIFATGPGFVLGGTIDGLIAPGTVVNQGDTFRFLTGNYSGTFANVGAGWSVFYGTGYVDLVRLQSVPEPTSLAALGLGALAVLRRRRAGAKK